MRRWPRRSRAPEFVANRGRGILVRGAAAPYARSGAPNAPHGMNSSQMRARRRFAPAAAGPLLLLALLPLLSRGGIAQVAPTTALTFNATADTYVDSGSATTNFNASTILRADASPVRIVYLRFAVSGVGGRHIEQARLRLGVAA